MATVIDGNGASISFSGALSSLNFCEVSINAPGLTVGSLDATCLSNSGYITKLPATLKEVPDITFTARYHATDWTAVASAVGVNNLVTFDFGSEGDIKLWCFLSSYTPGAGTNGESWNVDGTFTVTNLNGSYVETAPVYSA